MNLTRFESDGIELYINTVTGESFITVSSYARLVGVKSSIIEREKCVSKINGEKIIDDQNIVHLAVKYAIERNNYRSALFAQKMMYLGLSQGYTSNTKDIPLDGEEAMTLCQHIYPSIFKQKIEKKPEEKPKNITPKKTKSKESCIQIYLQQKYGGEIEVNTPFGRIDLLTSNKLIEIKISHSWKSAIGQLLAYSEFYPSHEKILYLFGDTENLNIDNIKSILSSLNIVLEIHQE